MVDNDVNFFPIIYLFDFMRKVDFDYVMLMVFLSIKAVNPVMVNQFHMCGSEFCGVCITSCSGSSRIAFLSCCRTLQLRCIDVNEDFDRCFRAYLEI